ncbi:helix-turn-helix domain-containing protein [Actinacidiphila yeochonensis]|uniref:helix-turn-helix domain-containing protein n=1 Tax=Actinacidiphila yeochonensis TaxID=89050 RepID=UPI001E602859|nr:helix-turn-helix transcriptional regulator [Actinacidiphila yeochonensis]
MDQHPIPTNPDDAPRQRLAEAIRRYRKGTGASLRTVAAQAFISHSTLQRWENGTREIKARSELEAVDTVLGAHGALLALWDQIYGVPTVRRRVSDSGIHVSEASINLASALPEQATSDTEGIFVPARLRDGSVVFVALDRRALLRGGVGIGAAAAVGAGAPSAAASAGTPDLAQRARRAASAYGETPVETLRRTRRLLIDNDNMLGPSRALASTLEGIEAIKDLRRDASGADRQDLMELQTQFAEFASWLYQDLGNWSAATFWLDRAFQWSHTVGDADLTTYVMARKAQLAGETHDLVDVVDLAEAAQRMARPRSRLAAVAQTYGAYGHALRGESSASERDIDTVRSNLDRIAGDPSPWGIWLNGQYVEVHRAQSLEALGKHDQAAAAFMSAIQGLPSDYHRDRGVYLARAAVAHAGAGVPEQAAEVGLRALAVAEGTGSGRIVQELARLDAALVPWQRLSEVGEFRSSFDALLAHES